MKAERNKRIIEEHEKNVSEEEIAKMLNIHYSTVHLIIRNFKEKNEKI
ncbi:MAG: helix-turn-helix domain-containing protein [Nanoarchaeota archaeon]